MTTGVYLDKKCYVKKERLNRLYGRCVELRPEPLNQFPEIYGLGLRNTDANSLYPWRSWAAVTIQRMWRSQ
jgi:hypothetical protein